MTRNKHIKQTDYRMIRSFKKIAVVLFCSLLFIQSNTLFAQVLNNNGAVISVTSGAVIQGDTLENTAGNILNYGTIGLRGHYINFGTTGGNGLYNIEGNWTNTGIFNPGSSTVNFIGNKNQSITSTGGEIFNNLVINNSGPSPINRIVLFNNVDVSGIFTFSLGNVETGANKLFLSNQAILSLDYTSVTGSRVIGKFERGINSIGSYLFPIGSDSNYNPLNLNPNIAPIAGSVLSEFINADPGDLGLPITDVFVEVDSVIQDGYWSLTSNGFSSNTFNINLDGAGFINPNPVEDITRIIRRPVGGNWIVDGEHVDAIGTVANRNNLTDNIDAPGTQFGLGNVRPLIIEQPVTIAVCDGMQVIFSVIATGYNPLIYQWQEFGATGWRDIPEAGIYSGTQTATLTISSADLSMNGYRYRVRISHLHGHVNWSDPATLYVDPIPEATATPDREILCFNETTNILLTSDVPGTTFELEVLYSGTILGTSPTLDGDAIRQALTNPGFNVDSVIYRIIPTGSGFALCEGVADTVVILVNPQPRIAVSTDPVLCYDGDAVFDITTVNTTVNDGGQWRYDVSVVYPAGVTGDWTLGLANETLTGSGVQTDNLTNTTDNVQTVVYTFTPHIDPGDGGSECQNGVPVIINVVLEPRAKVMGIIVSDTLCNDDNVVISLTTPTNPTIGIEFNLEIINNYPEISGYAPRTGMVVSDVINESINNSGDIARMIEYVFKPALIDPLGNQKCPGVNDTVRVWINPTPRVIPISTFDRICDDSFTNVELTTPTVMTHGQITFNYTVVVTGGAGDVIGNTSPQNGLDPGDLISFNYQNTSDTVQSVYYYTTPWSLETGCAPGIIQITEVKINPLPVQEIIITIPLSCVGGSDLALEAILAKGTGPMEEIHWQGPDYTEFFTAAISNVAGGQWTVTVTDNFGCVNVNSIVATADPITASYAVLLKPPYFTTLTCNDSEDAALRVWVTSPDTDPPYEYWIIKNDFDTIFYGNLTDRRDPSDLINTTDTIPNLGPGKYTLLLRNDIGCYIDPAPVIYINPPPPITFKYEPLKYSGFDVSCLGYSDGGITITETSGGVGDYTYFWYPEFGVIPGDVTAQTISGIPAGKYYIRITDGFGCVMLDSITLTEPDGIVIANRVVSNSTDGNFNISCNGSDDGTIDLTITGGSGIALYDWIYPVGANIVQNQEDQAGLIAGYYELEATDNNGCMIWFDTILTEPAPLNIVFNPTTTPDALYNIACNGGTADIDITVSGGSPTGYTYTWSTTDGSGIVSSDEDQSGLTAGIYYISIDDVNGCEYLDSIDITQPDPLSVIIQTTNITCESPGMDNGSIDIETSGGATVYPYTYTWSTTDGSGIVSSDEDQSGLTEGRYYITITDNYGCTLYDTVDIFLPPPLEFGEIISGYNGFNISCYGVEDGSISLDVTSGDAPYIFSWSGPGGFTSDQPSIGNLADGEYILSITDFNFCNVVDTFVLTEPGLLAIDAIVSVSDFGGYNLNCFGDLDGTIEIVPVNSVGTTRYFWTDGPQSSLRENLGSGSYGILIVDDNNCSRDSIVTLTEPEQLTVTYLIDKPYCVDMPDGTITLTPAGGVIVSDYFYTWWDNSTGSSVSGLAAGKYEVTIADANGCSITEIIKVTSERESCLTIPNAISPNGDRINDEWNIDLLYLYPDVEIKIFNRWGEPIWASERGYPRAWDGTSKGKNLPIDSYHYIINLNNGTRPILGNVTIIR